MAKLLDAKTSQNASYANSISIPFTVINAPQLFAQLTLSLAGAAGLVRAQYTGVAAIQLPLLPVLTSVTITVVEELRHPTLLFFRKLKPSIQLLRVLK